MLLVNHAYGLVPASMSLTEMEQDKKTGELKPVKVEKIDFSACKWTLDSM